MSEQPAGLAGNRGANIYVTDLQDGTTADVLTSAPAGTEAGVVTRNIPSGTQTVAGTVTATTAVPTTIYTGKKTVTTGGTRVALASTQAVKSVTVKALSANTNKIYVGDSTVASTTGFQLSAGDSVSLDIADLATVYLDADTNGEGVTYLGVN